jgi:uncharacterized protein YndB with AHSA1/START domain
MTAAETATTDDRDLVLTRLIDAPRAHVYRCWTEPELLKRFFAPLPYTTTHAELDVRPGGSNRITMRSPEGQDMPMSGVYLDAVPNEKIVFTDAFTDAWTPSEKPFFVGVLTFADEDGKTRYTAVARHWTAADKQAHEQMGFHQGWGQVADQLEALAKTL